VLLGIDVFVGFLKKLKRKRRDFVYLFLMDQIDSWRLFLNLRKKIFLILFLIYQTIRVRSGKGTLEYGTLFLSGREENTV